MKPTQRNKLRASVLSRAIATRHDDRVSVESAQKMIEWLAERKISVSAITVGDVAITFNNLQQAPMQTDWRGAKVEDIYRQYDGGLLDQLEQEQASRLTDE